MEKLRDIDRTVLDPADPKKKKRIPLEIAPAFRPVRRKLLRAFIAEEEARLTCDENTSGAAIVQPGDIVLQDERGQLSVLDADAFAAEFEFADEPAPEGFGTAKPAAAPKTAPKK